jgi:glutamate-ammonia-ligase adenylyltransferase
VTPNLSTFCERQLTRVRDSGALAAFDAAAPELRAALTRVLAGSDFVCESLARDAALARWLIDEAQLARALEPKEIAQRLQAALDNAPDLDGFMAALRQQRLREMVRIAWRDLAGDATLQETLADTSGFADAAIDAAVSFATRELARTYGSPGNAAGEPQP